MGWNQWEKQTHTHRIIPWKTMDVDPSPKKTPHNGLLKLFLYLFYFVGRSLWTTPPKFSIASEKWCLGLEDDPFLLGPGNFSGVNSLLNFQGLTFSNTKKWRCSERNRSEPKKTVVLNSKGRNGYWVDGGARIWDTGEVSAWHKNQV